MKDSLITVVGHTGVLTTPVEKICERLNLTYFYNKVKDNNPSNFLPYHNWYHTLCVVYQCFDGARYYNLPLEPLRHLIVAALFHDYGHSGGEKSDKENIKIATDAACIFIDHWNAGQRYHDINANTVKSIIEVTEYPFIHEPICIEQQIIRDADLMQSTFTTGYEMCIERLGKEISVSKGRDVLTREMILGQIEFLGKISFFTEWGSKAAHPEVRKFIEELRSLIEE